MNECRIKKGFSRFPNSPVFRPVCEIVTQYLAVSAALYEKIVNEGEAGVENYTNLLKAGGSNYPYVLLAEAGVDLAKPEPYEAIVRKMNAIMDEMERLLDLKESMGQATTQQSSPQ